MLGPSGLSWDVTYELVKNLLAVVGIAAIVITVAAVALGMWLGRNRDGMNRFSSYR